MANGGRRRSPPARVPVGLPEDVILCILARLPARSLARFRAVSKSWRAHIATHVARPADLAVVSTHETDEEEGATATGGGVRTVVRLGVFRPGAGVSALVQESPASLYAVSFTSAQRNSSAVLGSWDGVLCVQRSTTRPSPDGSPGRLAVEYVLFNPASKACATVDAPTDAAAAGGRVVGAYAHPDTGRFHLLHASGNPAQYRVLAVGDHAGWRVLRRPAAVKHHWHEVDVELCGGARRGTPGSGEVHFSMHPDHGPVSLHGGLHWAARTYHPARLLVSVFDMARKEFRVTEGPRTPVTARTYRRARMGVLPGRSGSGAGSLCLIAVSPPATMGMWVLDDYYANAASWRFARRIKMAAVDVHGVRENLSMTFLVATEVEVVSAAVDGSGGEIVLHLNGHVAACSLREGAWRRLRLSPTSRRLRTHKESFLGGDVSFGESARLLPEMDVDGHRCYCLPNTESPPPPPATAISSLVQ